jgi:hypothetical protein
LAPCPHCGAVNDATATVCHQCAAELPEHETVDEFAAPATAAGKSAAPASTTQSAGGRGGPVPGSTVGADELDSDSSMLAALQELRQLAAYPESVGSEATGFPGSTATRAETRARPGGRADTAPARPATGLAGSNALSVGTRTPTRGRSAVVMGALVLAILGAYGYYAYRQHSVGDVAQHPAASGEVKAGGSTIGAGTIVDPAPSPITKEVPIAATPAPAATPVADAPRIAPAPESGAPTNRVAGAVPGDARLATTDPAAAASRPATVQRRAGGDPRSPPEAAPPVARTSPGTGIDRQPPRLGSCTEGVAALGLCTPESTQGRQ